MSGQGAGKRNEDKEDVKSVSLRFRLVLFWIPFVVRGAKKREGRMMPGAE